MKNHARQWLAFVAGAIIAATSLAYAQDSIGQSNQAQPPDSTRRDKTQVQGGMQDSMQMLTGTRDSSQGSASGSLAPDNSGINKRDRNSEEMTADEQGQSAADIDMTKKIRRAVMDDDSLSTYARNVKIITKDGAVTLKGPVRSEQEKSAIEAKAAGIAGPGKVKNQIEVKAADKSKND